mmetsp:Transcript_134711/g.430353  ORF Transcript_134711/g.430353 Transcript_134711/m.430353 type:complete len:285 (-) Transcript_134711:1554-2408(-)
MVGRAMHATCPLALAIAIATGCASWESAYAMLVSKESVVTSSVVRMIAQVQAIASRAPATAPPASAARIARWSRPRARSSPSSFGGGRPSRCRRVCRERSRLRPSEMQWCALALRTAVGEARAPARACAIAWLAMRAPRASRSARTSARTRAIASRALVCASPASWARIAQWPVVAVGTARATTRTLVFVKQVGEATIAQSSFCAQTRLAPDMAHARRAVAFVSLASGARRAPRPPASAIRLAGRTACAIQSPRIAIAKQASRARLATSRSKAARTSATTRACA